MLSDRLAEAAAKACGQKFIVFGGDGERDDPPKDNDQNQQDPPDSQDGGQSGDNPPDDESDDDEDDGQDGDADLETKLDSERKKNIALGKEVEKLKAANSKAKADKDAAVERDELQTKYDKLESVVNTKFLEWSIQTNDKFNWIDTEDVVKALDREAINIDVETGEIDGLDLELKRIAKKKPHWLKKDDDEESGQPSGNHPHGGKTKQDQLDEKKLGEKYKIPGFGSQIARIM